MVQERQLPLLRSSRRRVRTPKRLNLEGRQRETGRWWSQKMSTPFLLGAQNFIQLTGAQIASTSGYNVEGMSSVIDEAEIIEDIDEAIKAARRAKIPGNDVINKFYRETRELARKVEGQYDWANVYFDKLVDRVVEVYPLSTKYGEDIKRKHFLR